jgi:hypothetical protein
VMSSHADPVQMRHRSLSVQAWPIKSSDFLSRLAASVTGVESGSNAPALQKSDFSGRNIPSLFLGNAKARGARSTRTTRHTAHFDARD